MADIVASVPEDTMRTFSIPGTAWTIALASATSTRVGAPYEVPFASCSRTTSSTASGACPRIMGPHDATKSMYSLPSTSQTREPFARS